VLAAEPVQSQIRRKAYQQAYYQTGGASRTESSEARSSLTDSNEEALENALAAQSVDPDPAEIVLAEEHARLLRESLVERLGLVAASELVEASMGHNPATAAGRQRVSRAKRKLRKQGIWDSES
jgi:hypothetical protein